MNRRLEPSQTPHAPAHYALIGSGRVARHLQFYLRSWGCKVAAWSRNGDPQFNSFMHIANPASRLDATVSEATHVLFAVRDGAIAEVSRPWWLSGKVLVHFSGSLDLPKVRGAHPLMTFGATLRPLAFYEQIPFVVEQGTSLPQLLPGLPNPWWELNRDQKGLYHALCSLAGNSTFLLWQKIGDLFETEVGLPRGLLSAYLHQVVDNSLELVDGAFTGPVARGDWSTVDRHLRTLNPHQDLVEVYRSYLKMAASAGFERNPEVP